MPVTEDTQFNMLDLSTVDNAGSYRSRVKRGAIVKVKGKRGVQRVVKAGGRGNGSWDALYVKPLSHEPVRSRRSGENWLEHSQLHHDHLADGVAKVKVSDVTHVAISGRRRARRRHW